MTELNEIGVIELIEISLFTFTDFGVLLTTPHSIEFVSVAFFSLELTLFTFERSASYFNFVYIVIFFLQAMLGFFFAF